MRKGIYFFIFSATFGLLFFLIIKFLEVLNYNWDEIWLRDWIGLQILAMLVVLSLGAAGVCGAGGLWAVGRD